MRKAGESGVPIPKEDIPNMIGKRVRLSWALSGCQWHLKVVDGDKVILETPVTGKPLIGRVDDLIYTRKHEKRAKVVKP